MCCTRSACRGRQSTLRHAALSLPGVRRGPKRALTSLCAECGLPLCWQLAMFQPAHGQTGASATQRWYDEIDDYDFSTHQSGTGKPTGHFTQVVWYGTTHVGAARSSDGIYIAANYSPPPGIHIGGILGITLRTSSQETPRCNLVVRRRPGT